MKMNTIFLGEYVSPADHVSKNVQKFVLGAYGGDSGGNVCWHYCKTYGGGYTASVWGTCYEAYHECTRRGEVAECYCNG